MSLVYSSDNGAVKRWLCGSNDERKCMMHRQAPTNLLMCGWKRGVASVPVSSYASFLAEYAKDVANGKKLYFTECRGELFRFFVDFDLVTDAVEENVIPILSRMLVECLARFYPSAGSKVLEHVVCTAPLPRVGGEGRRKMGIHVIFPNALVGQEQALTIREALLPMACRFLGPVVGVEDIDEMRSVVDGSVYRDATSGLRMIGSRKLKTCPACKNGSETRPSCVECVHVGKVDAERPAYRVVGQYGASGKMEDATKTLVSNICLAVRAASIRAWEGTNASPTEGWERYVGCPFPPPLRGRGGGGGVVQRILSGAAPAAEGEFKDDAASTRAMFSRSVVIPKGDKRFAAALRLVRGSNAMYADVDAKELMNVPSQGREGVYYLKVQGVGSHYCQNKQADHASNTVYFKLAPPDAARASRSGYCSQRCFCKKETKQGRLDGSCVQYESRKVSMGGELTTLFWPQAASMAGKGEKRAVSSALESFKSGLVARKAARK